jgi:hypothetical protein
MRCGGHGLSGPPARCYRTPEKRSSGKDVKSGADQASPASFGVAFEGRIQLVNIAGLALDALSFETTVRTIKMARSGMVMA